MSTTEVTVPLASVVRSVSPGMFADLCNVEPEFTRSGDMFTVTLACDLDVAATTTVRDRLLTANSEQEAERAAIRALIDADPSPLAQALARNWLGDD